MSICLDFKLILQLYTNGMARKDMTDDKTSNGDVPMGKEGMLR